MHVAELPDPTPHTVFAQWFHEALGGTSAGKALNLRRLGLDVTLSTLVGDDATGEQIVGALRAEGIAVISRRSDNGSERHANLMDPDGRRLSIYLNLPTVPGPGSADDTLRSGRHAALAAADAVVVDLADHSRPVLHAAHAIGKPVWCDLHDYDGRSAFHEEFLGAADYLFVSDERLPDPEAFLHDQVAAGKRLVVCTQGARGAIALEPGRDVVRVPAEPVQEVVDTNGAGDAFFGGFLQGLTCSGGLRPSASTGVPGPRWPCARRGRCRQRKRHRALGREGRGAVRCDGSTQAEAHPPSALTTAPLTLDASSHASQEMTVAISSASAMRAMVAMDSCARSMAHGTRGLELAPMAVMTPPGSTALERMPLLP